MSSESGNNKNIGFSDDDQLRLKELIECDYSFFESFEKLMMQDMKGEKSGKSISKEIKGQTKECSDSSIDDNACKEEKIVEDEKKKSRKEKAKIKKGKKANFKINNNTDNLHTQTDFSCDTNNQGKNYSASFYQMHMPNLSFPYSDISQYPYHQMNQFSNFSMNYNPFDPSSQFKYYSPQTPQLLRPYLMTNPFVQPQQPNYQHSNMNNYHPSFNQNNYVNYNFTPNQDIKQNPFTNSSKKLTGKKDDNYNDSSTVTEEPSVINIKALLKSDNLEKEFMAKYKTLTKDEISEFIKIISKKLKELLSTFNGKKLLDSLIVFSSSKERMKLFKKLISLDYVNEDIEEEYENLTEKLVKTLIVEGDFQVKKVVFLLSSNLFNLISKNISFKVISLLIKLSKPESLKTLLFSFMDNITYYSEHEKGNELVICMIKLFSTLSSPEIIEAQKLCISVVITNFNTLTKSPLGTSVIAIILENWNFYDSHPELRKYLEKGMLSYQANKHTAHLIHRVLDILVDNNRVRLIIYT